MCYLFRWERIFLIVLFCLGAACVSRAQTFTVLANFDGTNGAMPTCALIQATDGYLYGTTHRGGTDHVGTIFRMTLAGAMTVLHHFEGTDGEYPYAGMLQATDGNFYGTTWEGGAYGGGTFFRYIPGATLTTLYNFPLANGHADSEPIQSSPNFIYGSTPGTSGNNGTIFKVGLGGKLTTVYTFCAEASCADGSKPSGLTEAADGNVYGTTYFGGTSNFGTFFKFTPAGTLTTLFNFSLANPNPYAPLVQAASGVFYGTIDGGYGSYANGSVFEITPTGVLTTLHQLVPSEGQDPEGGLIIATDGNLYGDAKHGGIRDGTLFQVTPAGAFTVLHSFNGTDGSGPIAALMQATDGNLYGSANAGGANGDGTIFRLSMGLGPFVKMLPAFGKAGSTVQILGTNLAGATGVAFDGLAAAFSVVSPSLITATVPTGATTGTIQVTTPGGTLASNVPFRVR